jgi:hypothetical protein
MKKVLTPVLALTFLVAVSGLASANQHMETGSWTGLVSDSDCGGEKAMDASHADCAAKCVKNGKAKWAIYNTASKATYVLSGKDDPSKFVGKEVTVKGQLNKDTKTIEETSIELVKK